MKALEMVDRYAERHLRPVTLALAKAKREVPRNELRIEVLEEIVGERAAQVAAMLALAWATPEPAKPSKPKRKRGRSLAEFYAEAIAAEDTCRV